MSPGLGGLELYCLSASEELQNRDFNCFPVVAMRSRLAEKFEQLNFCTFKFIRGARYLPIKNATRIARLINILEIDIVHIHWAKDLALAVLAKRLSSRKPKLVYTRHMEIYGDKRDLYHKFVYSSVDLMITVTKRMAQQARECLPLATEKIMALYLGVHKYTGDRETENIRFRNANNIKENAFVVGLVGRIEPGKRQILLLEALEKIIGSCTNIHCVIVGAVHQQDYYNELIIRIENGPLINHVSILGFQDNPRSAMAAFDVAVLTTPCETFGLVLIEAMSTGTAVVGSRACGVMEIIDDNINGLMFEPDNSQDLADNINKLYQDSALRMKLASAGKSNVEEKFDYSRHFDQLGALIENTLEFS